MPPRSALLPLFKLRLEHARSQAGLIAPGVLEGAARLVESLERLSGDPEIDIRRVQQSDALEYVNTADGSVLARIPQRDESRLPD